MLNSLHIFAESIKIISFVKIVTKMKINASPLRRFLSIQRPLFLEKYLIENVEKYISKPSTFQNFLGGDAPGAPLPPPPPKKSPPVEITLRRT